MDAVPAADAMILGFGLSFADLATREGLMRLDRAFLERLVSEDAALYARLLKARAAPESISTLDESELVVALGPHLDAFVAMLFDIEEATLALARETHALDPIHACKRLFVQRQAVKKYPDPSGFEGPALRAALEARIGETLTEHAFAHHVAAWEEAGEAEILDIALRYAAWATLTMSGQAAHPGNTLFRVPRRLDYQHLIPVKTIERDGVTMLRLPEDHWRPRDPCARPDPRMQAAVRPAPGGEEVPGPVGLQRRGAVCGSRSAVRRGDV